MKEKLGHIFQILTASEKKHFWIHIALNIVISIADIIALVFLLLVINFYINASSPAMLDFLPAWMLDQDSIALILVFFIFFSLKNVAAIIVSNAQFKFMGKLAIRISKQKLGGYLDGSFERFVNIDSAEHIRKIAFQPFEFSQHIVGGIQQIIIQSILILLTIAAIVLYNPQLFFLLLVILLPPVALVFLYIKRKVSSGKRNIHAANELSFRYLLDALKGYVESNIYQRRAFFLERFAGARLYFSRYLFNSLAVQAMPGRIIESFAVLGLFFLIMIIKWAGIDDSAMLITIGAFVASAYKIIPGIVKIINAAGQMKAYEFSINDLEEENNQPGIKENGIEPIGSIKFRDISFQYGDNPVLKDISFTINKGELTGITGKSGKGKTTILNLILGFLKPGKGELWLNDKPVSAESLQGHWQIISYARQQPFLIHDSILKNITLEEGAHYEQKLEQAVKISGLKNLLDQFPEGINTIIAENGKNISGGQQQRVVLARVLYKDAPVILLDEPFNELDENSTTCLVKYFRELAASGKIVIMVTHDAKCLSYCNKIISLDEQ